MYPNSTCMLMDGPSYTGRATEPDYCYPASYGLGSCEAWDEKLQPFCANPDGTTRFDAPSWCTDAWCYVNKRACEMPESAHDLTPSAVDEDTTTDDQLVYSYATCGIASNYAKFRRTALMNASEIVPAVAAYVADIRDFVEQQFSVVQRTEGEAVCLHTDSCECSDCDLGEGSWEAFDESYRYSISLNSMTVTHSGLTTKDSKEERYAQCLARLMEGKFKRIARLEYDDPTRLAWLSYGDQQSAVWFGLPGIAWCPDTSSPYDPRYRPWYVSAVSGPKDLIIVLDTSNSMTKGNRWRQALDASRAVLDTLTAFDYTTVVTFNTMASVFDDKAELIAATQENLAQLKTWLSDLYPLGGTDFRAGLSKAFNVIDASSTSSSQCNRLMLFLTDGIDGSGLDVAEVEAMNKKGYTIFTYSFGNDADKTLPKQIACENKGIWYHVPDGANIGDAMSKYYTYYVEALSSQKQIRWTMYEEISTKNELITGCLPAYDRSTSPVRLLGVACMDMSIVIGVAEFKKKPDFEASMALMRAQASTCFRVSHEADALEQLRELSAGPEAVCSPPPSTTAASAAVATGRHRRGMLIAGLIMVWAHGRHRWWQED